MCTVTYIPLKAGFILTSNRDEHAERLSLTPAYYLVNGKYLLYPKDKQAEGTWIACDPFGNIACLFNGAYSNHRKKENYRKSRGKILLESFSFSSFERFSSEIDLSDIEPFTLIMVSTSPNVKVHELIWDGVKKHLHLLPDDQPLIRSSYTLYSEEAQIKRRNWFQNWLFHHDQTEDAEILEFHNSRHGNDPETDILMLAGEVQTVSISQVKMNAGKVSFYYLDKIKEKVYQTSLTDPVAYGLQ